MKILLKILFGLLLVLIAALVLTPLLLDPNDFKDEIRARVAQETGHELTLDGDLKLSLFPWVGIEISDASLAQPPGFGDEPFARIGQAQVHARLLSLFGGRLELGQIRGKGLALNLIRARDGRTNWDDIAGPSSSGSSGPIASPSDMNGRQDRTDLSSSTERHPARLSTAEPNEIGKPFAAEPTLTGVPGAAVDSTATAEPRSADGPVSDDRSDRREVARESVQPPVARLTESPVTPPLVEAESSWQPPQSADRTRQPLTAPAGSPVATFTIGGLAFDDVRIAWDDRQTGTHLIVGGLTLSTGPLAQGAPVELHLAGDLVEEGRGLTARLALDSMLTLSNDGRILTLAPFELRLERMTMADGLSAMGSLTGNLHAEPEARRYRFADLVLGLTVSDGSIAGQPVQVQAQADLELDLLEQTMKLDGLTLDSDALRLSGEAAGTGLLTAPGFQGSLALAQFDLRAWLERHGLSLPDMADPRSLTRVAFRSGWRWADGRLDLYLLTATLDRTRISGAAAMIQGMPLGYRFDLTADELDLDAYLPPSARVASPGGQSSGASAVPSPSAKADSPPSTPSIPPPGVLQPPEVDLTLEPPSVSDPAPLPASVASASTDGLFPIALIRELDLDGRLRVGQLRVSGMTLGDADARIMARDGRMRVDERVGRFYQGNLEGNASLFADEDPPDLMLVQRAEGIQVGPLLNDLIGEDVATGHGRVEIDLSARGQSPDALKRTLAGKAAIHLSMGSIKGFNLEQIIRRAEARLKGRPAPPREPERTEFSELRASAAIANGVLTNQDLHAASNYIHASGEGSVDLGNERLDYLLTPKIVDPPKGRGIKEIEDIPIPIRITGSYRAPDWDIDLAPILSEAAKRELKKELDKKGGSKLQELEERTGIKGLEQGLRRLFNF